MDYRRKWHHFSKPGMEKLLLTKVSRPRISKNTLPGREPKIPYL